jgi:hypothetical protein
LIVIGDLEIGERVDAVQECRIGDGRIRYRRNVMGLSLLQVSVHVRRER